MSGKYVCIIVIILIKFVTCAITLKNVNLRWLVNGHIPFEDARCIVYMYV